MPAAYLPERRFLRISGQDAESFLQNLITTDVGSLPVGEARSGALLTPQGKILFDFVVWREGNGFLIETDGTQIEALSRRLTMYKLRASVTIDQSGDEGVTVVWGKQPGTDGALDIRFDKAGIRLMRIPGKSQADSFDGDYDALRAEAGVVVSGADFTLQDAFPHDVLMDLNGGLSFRKGCYVGQEVVSRMQHRGTARRRVVQVQADSELPTTGMEITAEGKPVGSLGTVNGRSGLAIVRIDRVGAAMAAGVPILAADVPVTLTLPAWSGLSFPLGEEEAGS